MSGSAQRNRGLGRLIFLNCCGEDAAPYALALKQALETNLSAARVFLDIRAPRDEGDWSGLIEPALRLADVVIGVVGRSGLDSAEAGPGSDGARRELAFALAHKPDRMMVVLAEDAGAPDASRLPKNLAGLARAPLRLDLARWDESVAAALQVLKDDFKFVVKTAAPQKFRLTPIEAGAAVYPWELLADELAAWEIQFNADPVCLLTQRVEMVRIFEFGSFDLAIDFINAVARHAAEVDHHPDILNSWRRVKISLSTHDAGHRMTALDVEFARFLERQYLEFCGAG